MKRNFKQLRYGYVLAVCLLVGIHLARPFNEIYSQSVPATATASFDTIKVVGYEETVYDSQKQSCPQDYRNDVKYDVPDSPVRAFRDSAGSIHLHANNHSNRGWTGTTLDNIRRDNCRSALRSQADADPAKYADYQTIGAFYTVDGRNVTAFINNEYHGELHNRDCVRAKPGECWMGSITFARSNDNGFTFKLEEAPDNLIAAVPYRFDIRMFEVGYYGPLSLVYNAADKFYYMFFQAGAYQEQFKGTCLMRNPDPSKPEGWRAWDGKGFTVQFANPYVSTIANPSQNLCQPIQILAMPSSVTYNTVLQQFVAVYRYTDSVVYSTSRDLLRWSAPIYIMRSIPPETWRPGAPAPTTHFSLIDPASTSRNFDVTGRSMYLFYTKYRVANDEIDLESGRDLMRIRVEIRDNKPFTPQQAFTPLATALSGEALQKSLPATPTDAITATPTVDLEEPYDDPNEPLASAIPPTPTATDTPEPTDIPEPPEGDDGGDDEE